MALLSSATFLTATELALERDEGLSSWITNGMVLRLTPDQGDYPIEQKEEV
jgi:hypothetical protein